MSKCISAHTNPGSEYPGYINFTREDDGSVTVHFRGDPKRNEGSYICGYAADKGKPGRCTPGDDRCNNYCNMAPQKGPMLKAPADCTQVHEGATATLKLTAADFEAFIASVPTVLKERTMDITEADREAARKAMVRGYHDCGARWQAGPGRSCQCDDSRIDGCEARVEAIAAAIRAAHQ